MQHGRTFESLGPTAANDGQPPEYRKTEYRIYTDSKSSVFHQKRIEYRMTEYWILILLFGLSTYPSRRALYNR